MSLIGERNIFAIEYEITDSQSARGKVCLWINNIRIGNYENVVYLNYISDSLSDILNTMGRLRFKELEDLADKVLFEVLLQRRTSTGEKLLKYDVTFVQLGESFDDYIIRVVERNEEVVFLWQFAKDINAKVFSGSVPKDVIYKVYLEYIKRFFSK